ncbi:MAG: hypothetical protein JW866_04530 [Ignavibacteriales bacterium]|nr:hypothetical protein [Ignavibacteriales bacterium]
MKNNNIINNSEKYWVTKLLKSLPKKEAPADFEFKLMTRIQNRNFNIKSEQNKRRFTWIWIPAAATISTIIILFTIFYNFKNDKQNPLMERPSEINQTLSEEEPPRSIEKSDNYSEHTIENKEEMDMDDKNVSPQQNYRVVIKPNDVIEKETIDLPYANNKGIEIDEYITNNELNIYDRNYNLKSVSDGEFNFDGFYLQSTTNPMELEKLKAKIDSVEKKMERLEKDSKK